MNNKIWFLFLFTIISSPFFAQNLEEDALYIKDIYDYSLKASSCYEWLDHLSEEIGGRLAGSSASFEAIDYTKGLMTELGLNTYVQECLVPRWVRGAAEEVFLHSSEGIVKLNALSLGNSEGTGGRTIMANVIELHSLEELENIDPIEIAGKIVFFNRPMDPTKINTFHAYGGAVDQRGVGPMKSGEKGAIACLVRSMTTRLDDIPHTGSTYFAEGDKKIPAIAISTNDAEKLSRLLKESPNLEVSIKSHCGMISDTISYNVVGEIKGSEFPNEYIVVGGHLDSWDVGGGAHDDGSGCVQSIQVMKTLLALGYQPKRTIRCVMFMNEENGLGGGRAYADSANAKKEFHMAALESDSGGFTPRAFSFDADKTVFTPKYQQVQDWLKLFEPYGVTFMKGGSGADINPLKTQKGLLIGLRPDSQRYFDFHHTAIDRIEAVNQRELELGAAAMTSLIYLLDKYGIE